MTTPWIRTAMRLLLLAPCTSLVCRAQQQAVPAHRTDVPMTVDVGGPSRQVLDVFASKTKSGELEAGLSRDDFEVLDEGKAVPAIAFFAPQDAGRRPVVLWVMVQCTMPGMTNDGSDFLRNYTTELASGLTRLGPGEAYGVAHWCDDGASALDLMPNRRIAQLGPTVAAVLAPLVKPPRSGIPGEDALMRVVHDTVAATARYNPEAEPVLLFLYGDHSAAAALQVNALLRELLAASATVFLVNDGLAKSPSAALGEVTRIVGNLGDRTGGGYFHVPLGSTDPFLYAQAIASVLEHMHGRYQISWTPRRADGDEHVLAVRLTAAARKAHPGVELRSRTAYETRREPTTTTARIVP